MVKIRGTHLGTTIHGTDGDDDIDGAGGSDDIYGYGGNDFLVGGGGRRATDRVWGGEGDDTIYGGGGRGFLFGEGGNDWVAGQGGDDHIDGGMGNDVLIGGTGNDSFLGGIQGYDLIDGGEGIDTISFEYAEPRGQGVTLDLGATQNSGREDHAKASVSGGNVRDVDFVKNVENIQGSYGYDTFTGDSKSNKIEGFYGNDHIYGGGGNDFLYGEQDRYVDEGAFPYHTYKDYLYGGIGHDFLYGQFGDDELYGQEGRDELHGGEGADKLYGGEGDDRLYGGDWHDVLDGGPGSDTLVGGAGADTYIFDNPMGNSGDRDVICDMSSGNIMLLRGTSNPNLVVAYLQNSIVGISMPPGVIELASLSGSGINPPDICNPDNHGLNSDIGESPTLRPSAPVHPVYTVYYGAEDSILGRLYIGTNGDDAELTGSEKEDWIVGFNGADTIDGGLGNDRLDGGDGNDTLNGGAGEDNLNGGAGSDTLNGGLGNDRLDGGEGYDTLDGGVGSDILNGGTGSDTLNGGLGNDRLDGGEGDDSLDGGAGADDYVFTLENGHDVIQGDADGGNLIFKDAEPDDFSLERDANDNVVVTTLSGSVTINKEIYASDRYKVYYGADNTELGDLSVGTDADDRLSGSVDRDWILGLGGDDYLSSGVGNDRLDGGDGEDFLFGGSDNDNIHGGEGRDILYGGSGDDTLNGGAGNDLLSGGEGDDTLYASAGDDKLYGGEGADSYIFESGYGADYIDSDTDGGKLYFRGASTVENLIFSRVNSGNDVKITLNGDSVVILQSAYYESLYSIYYGSDDTSLGRLWVGTARGDELAGSADADWIIGLGGWDVLQGAGASDRLEGGGGRDHLFGGADNDQLIGGADGDVLYGDAGEDTLDGGEGADAAAYGNSSKGVRVNLLLQEQAQIDFDGTHGFIANGNEAVGDTLISIENIWGSNHNDWLTGDSNNNRFIAEDGNDRIEGGEGTDTYIFEIGHGSDTIFDVAGDEMILQFGNSGVASYIVEDFDSSVFSRNGNNLEINLDKNPDDGITDKITIIGAYLSDPNTEKGNTAYTINIEFDTGGSHTQQVLDVWSALG